MDTVFNDHIAYKDAFFDFLESTPPITTTKTVLYLPEDDNMFI